jgi:excisionase family DNA binding protein
MHMETAIRPVALRPAQACQALSVGRDKLFALLASGEIASFREGGTRLIPVSAIEEYVQRKTREAQA